MTVTRFPPSPTGYLHIGGARTALYSWLHARQNDGKFVLRIEDTDLERSTQESVQAILDGMEWLGLGYDEGPYYQTHRFDRYEEVIDGLLSQGHAYHCECSREHLDEVREQQKSAGLKPKYDGRCRELGFSQWRYKRHRHRYSQKLIAGIGPEAAAQSRKSTEKDTTVIYVTFIT